MSQTAGLDILAYGEELLLPARWSVWKRHPKVLNLVWEDRLLSICASTLPLGPGNLVLSCASVDWIEHFAHHQNEVRINGVRFKLSPEALWRVPRLPFAVLPSRIERLERAFEALAPPNSVAGMSKTPFEEGSFASNLALSLARAQEHLKAGRYTQGAGMLKGRGFGSTPSGNDFAAGYILALAWMAQGQKNKLSKIADLLLFETLGTDPLSDAFLRRARALKPDSDWVDLLLVLSGKKDEPLDALNRVLSHGSSSGADALAGFFLALRHHHWEVL